MLDHVLGKLSDYGEKKIKDWLSEGEAQRLLLKCFNDYYAEDNENCFVDKKAILAVDESIIRPNNRPEDIINSLGSVFEKCIITDDKFLARRIETEIVYNYLKEANVKLIDLCDLDNDIHKVEDEVIENRKLSQKNHEEVKQKFQEIPSILDSNAMQTLQFINELDNSKLFCYIILNIRGDIDDEILTEVENQTSIAGEYKIYQEKGFDYISIYFMDPLCQREMKEYLKGIDEVFANNGIGIYGIYSHN